MTLLSRSFCVLSWFFWALETWQLQLHGHLLAARAYSVTVSLNNRDNKTPLEPRGKKGRGTNLLEEGWDGRRRREKSRDDSSDHHLVLVSADADADRQRSEEASRLPDQGGAASSGSASDRIVAEDGRAAPLAQREGEEEGSSSFHEQRVLLHAAAARKEHAAVDPPTLLGRATASFRDPSKHVIPHLYTALPGGAGGGGNHTVRKQEFVSAHLPELLERIQMRGSYLESRWWQDQLDADEPRTTRILQATILLGANFFLLLLMIWIPFRIVFAAPELLPADFYVAGTLSNVCQRQGTPEQKLFTGALSLFALSLLITAYPLYLFDPWTRVVPDWYETTLRAVWYVVPGVGLFLTAHVPAITLKTDAAVRRQYENYVLAGRKQGDAGGEVQKVRANSRFLHKVHDVAAPVALLVLLCFETRQLQHGECWLRGDKQPNAAQLLEAWSPSKVGTGHACAALPPDDLLASRQLYFAQRIRSVVVLLSWVCGALHLFVFQGILIFYPVCCMRRDARRRLDQEVDHKSEGGAGDAEVEDARAEGTGGPTRDEGKDIKGKPKRDEQDAHDASNSVVSEPKWVQVVAKFSFVFEVLTLFLVAALPLIQGTALLVARHAQDGDSAEERVAKEFYHRLHKDFGGAPKWNPTTWDDLFLIPDEPKV